jgi:8-oxo-dGTP diphosphatase
VEHDNVIEVVAAVIEHDGLILACRRRQGKSAGGKWEFPGGKVEPGEHAEVALSREIREELAIEIAVGTHLRTDETVVSGQVIRLSCFHSILGAEGPLASTDHDQMQWMSPEGLAQLDWAAPDLPMVRQLVKGVN